MTCTKVRYRDAKQARSAIKRITRSSNEGTKPIRAYLCPACGGYHITHISKEMFEENKLLTPSPTKWRRRKRY